MPIYEYQCTNCQNIFELRRSFSDMDAPTTCPKCGKSGKRLVSAFGCKTGSYLRPAAGAAFRGGAEASR